MRRFIIYAWICPETGNPVYVGKTCRTVSWRMRSHILDATKHPDKKKYIWLNAALSRGHKVSAKELERCDAVDAPLRERFWIEHLAGENKLLNVARGGGGGRGPENIKWTQEIDARLGVDFDTDIAKDVGCHYQTVAYRRICLGIPARKDRRTPKNKVAVPDAVIPLLGTKPDATLAAEFGLKPLVIFRLRVSIGIKPSGLIDVHWRRRVANAEHRDGQGICAALRA